MKSYYLYLVRNMPCVGNLEGRYIGRTESPLPESSVRELLQKKRDYLYPQVQDFYASPSVRCVDTLKLLYPAADPEVILQLAECDFGDWENHTAAELTGQPEFDQWLQNGGVTTPPNGESSGVFFQRICSGFEMLVQHLMMEGKTEAMLVTHAGIITSLLSAYAVPQAKPLEWMCAPGEGYVLRLTPSLWMRSRVLEVVGAMPIERAQDER